MTSLNECVYYYHIVASGWEPCQKIASMLGVARWRPIQQRHHVVHLEPDFDRIIIDTEWLRNWRNEDFGTEVMRELHEMKQCYPFMFRLFNRLSEQYWLNRWSMKPPEIGNGYIDWRPKSLSDFQF